MEAIPLVALAGLYIISNKDNNKSNKNTNKKIKEEFANMNQQQSTLSNTNIPPKNYPILDNSEAVDTVQKYESPNVATDKYFDQNNYKKQIRSGQNVGNNIQQVYSLTGDYISSTDFTHNNMVPFNGGKVRGQVYNIDNAESILDNMSGVGSQTIEKKEQAPLFKPQENVQFANGAPNMSDFYQSRVNPGRKVTNVKPFECQNVGPGVNQGYGVDGSGGYNAGMESRDSWLPKTVDQLRVATNPKIEYSLEDHQGPANSYIKNRGNIGRVEKQNPDSFFIQTQDRWLTTTGQEKAQMIRSAQEIHDTSRATTTQSYSGIASSENATYAPQNYEPTSREQLPGYQPTHSNATGRGNHEGNDRFQKSHTNYANNRGSNKQPDSMRSAFSGAIGAVIAPIMDILNPTRREEFSNNIRVYGNHRTTSVKESYVTNPNDTLPITIKETTLHAPNLFINGQKNGTGYMISQQEVIPTERQSTSCEYYGDAGGAATGWGNMSYDAGYAQINNEVRQNTVVARTNHGNTQIYNQNMNVSIAKNEYDRNNTRQWVPTNMPRTTLAPNNYGSSREPQMYNSGIASDRMTPDLLNAFKENPYTHSLTNVA